MKAPAIQSELAPQAATIGVLDRNRALVTRIARIVGAAAELTAVAFDDDPAAVRAALAPDTRLLLCDGADLELALEWADTKFPRARIITWSHGPLEPLIERARHEARVVSVLGWPSFLSMPRSWELALAARRALHQAAAPTAITELFAGTPVVKKFKPSSSRERDQVVATLADLATRAGAGPRMIGKISEVSHELLMNAMYDAPVNHYGQPRYAHDRRAEVALEAHEVPTARFATDGSLIGIQVTDPFGRLTRGHVLASIARGQAAAHAERADQVIDASHGGAGLGLWKIYSSSAITIVDVIAGHATSVTAVFDIDVGPREARVMPPSLHVFDPSAQ
ncbi:MAG: hypothetical protein AB7O24_00150 [Kofleriaceae bacterium]